MNRMFILSAYTAKFQTTASWALISGCIGVAISFIFGSATMAWVFVGMIALDFITGIIKSIKLGIPITSTRMRDMFYKWIAYLSVLLCTAMIGTFTGQIWLHAAAYGWTVGNEFISVCENCEVITGRRIPFLDRIKRIVKAMGEK